jgi:hypothetical protein
MNKFIWCWCNCFLSNFSFLLPEKKDEREDRITDISQLYQIFPDEVLGSGQFGIVYGGESLQNNLLSLETFMGLSPVPQV